MFIFIIRWINKHLSTVNHKIDQLKTAFDDGLLLISLVEVLSGKKINKFNPKPTMISQKLENINIALNFLTKEENIKIVNIGKFKQLVTILLIFVCLFIFSFIFNSDSSDIFNGNNKLILGLIWTLILHYSISKVQDENSSINNEKANLLTPQQKLLKWINNRIKTMQVNNFTSDWNDGKALGALVNSFSAKLSSDWQRWNSKDAFENITKAMKEAKENLGVLQLIRPKDMVNPDADELSMMTYLSQFPSAKVNEKKVEEKPKYNQKGCDIYGPGVESCGNFVGEKTHFTVKTKTNEDGKVDVYVLNPQGKVESVHVELNENRYKTYTCTYRPKMDGIHKVFVNLNGTNGPRSPFHVYISKKIFHPSLCNVNY